MILLHRFTPAFVGIVTLACFLLVSFTSGFLWFALPASLMIVFLSIARLAEWDFRSDVLWNLLATPLLFLVSGFLVLVFLESVSLRVVISLVTSGFLFFFCEHLFTYFHLQSRYQAYALEFTSVLMSVLALFFIGIGFYGFLLFLHLPLWILTIIFIIVSALLVREALWASKVENRQAAVFAVAYGLILGELFLSISFLPTSFIVNSTILAILFYILLGLTRAHFLGKLNPLVIKRYVFIGSLLMFLILGTARWV